MTDGAGASVSRRSVTPVSQSASKTEPAIGAITWAEAHRTAHMSATRALDVLDIDRGGVSVDVVTALGKAGCLVLWRPMKTLFGAYVNEPGGVPGVVVNPELPRAARRYTCAHELGHHWLGHSTSADDGSSISATPFETEQRTPSARGRAWPTQEKLAEAFARWFLMPRRVVLNALALLGLDEPHDPVDIYRLSLLLGISYRTLAAHMPDLRLVDRSTATAWARVVPGRIKGQLDAGAPPPVSRRGDVWVVDQHLVGQVVSVTPGDRLLVGGPHTIATSCVAPGTDAAPVQPVAVGRAAGARGAGTVYEVGPAHSAGGRIHIHLRGGEAVADVNLRPSGLDPRGLT